MAVRITITRNNGVVSFSRASIDVTENVDFLNLDPDASHQPFDCANVLGPAGSPPSNSVTVSKSPGTVTYGCKLHANESGAIDVYPIFSAGTTSLKAKAGNAYTSPNLVP